VERWVIEHDYKGYRYWDGLSSWLRVFTFKNWTAEIFLQQFVKRFPFNIRPLLGIKPLMSTKGMGFFAKAFLSMWQVTGENIYKERAVYCLEWLMQNHSKGYSGYCWGNATDYASRGMQTKSGTPTIVWSGLTGHAFLEAYEVLKDEKYLKVARSVCDFIMKDLPLTDLGDSFCISYVTFKLSIVHNSNMIGASLLARTFKHTGEVELRNYAAKAMKYSCDRQLENGEWYYANSKTQKWIDNWHTAYNLDALKHYIDSTGDTTFKDNLEKGYSYWKKTFFSNNGKPYYYNDRLRWVDIQCASQAIDTFSYFSDHDKEALLMATKVAMWSIENMQDRSGYFYYRILKWKKVKIPMIHWGQATMMSGLSHLLLKS